MATLKHIAEQAGVSVETVSRVLRGEYRQVGERGKARVKQIMAIADGCAYRANAAARSMKSNRSLIAGVIVPIDEGSRLAHAVTMEIIFGINEELAACGYLMSLITVTSEEGRTGKPASRALRELVADGFIIIDSLGTKLDLLLNRTGKPLVWANQEPSGDNVAICRDEFLAGELAVEALAAAGHTRILSVGRQSAEGCHFSFARRAQGVATAADRLGMTVKQIRLALSRDTSVTNSSFVQAVKACPALILSDIYLARRVIADLERDNVPLTSYSVACCDDADEMGEILPWLSRATFNRFELGKLAGRALLEKINGQKSASQILKPTWIPGDSIHQIPNR